MPIQAFDYAKLTGQDPASKSLVREFARHHAQVISIEGDSKERKTSGVAYKTLSLAFADSQQVALNIKKTGDIFQVLINGRVTPIRQQDDLNKAVIEIIDRLDAGRKAFQKRQAMVKVDAPKPKNLSMTAANQIKILEEKRDNLKAEIEAVRAERTALEDEIKAGQAASNEAAGKRLTEMEDAQEDDDALLAALTEPEPGNKAEQAGGVVKSPYAARIEALRTMPRAEYDDAIDALITEMESAQVIGEYEDELNEIEKSRLPELKAMVQQAIGDEA